MAVSVTRDDLLAEIQDDQLAKLATGQREGDADTIDTQLAAAAARVTLYTRRYALDAAHERRLICQLAIAEICRRIMDEIPKKYADLAKAALQEITDIRDGKFKDLPLAEEAAPATVAGGGRSGSAARIGGFVV